MLKATQKEFTADDFELEKVIGQGKFGKVFKAKHRESGRVVALKQMLKSELRNDEQLLRQMRREVELQAHLEYAPIHEAHRFVGMKMC